MALHGGTPYPLALSSMTQSDARDFFASKAFAGYKTGLEGRQKVTLAILNRFDNVTRAIGIVIKVFARRG